MSKDKDLYLEADNVTYEEEPEEYCKHIFAEALDRNDQLQPLNLINYRFYEGYDERLKERASNTRAKRSSLFVHEVTPAINTRIGQAVSRLEEEESPVTLRPVNDSPTDQEKDDIAWCQRTLNRQLRDCGYLTGGFQEHILGAEIFRTPSTVKVGWQTYSEDEAIRVNPTEYQTEQAVLVGRKVQPKVVWRRVKRGRPYVQWLHTHEFLYEPNVSDFAKESVYAIHGMWLDKNQVVAYAKEYGCDMDAVHAFFDDNDGGSDDGGIATETVQDASQAAEGTPQIESQREGKFSLAEIYVVVYDDDGGQHVDQCVLLGVRDLVKQERTDLKGIKFPFVPVVIHRLPGRMENFSSVEQTKELQRIYNEAINSYIDGITYRIFPPFKKETGTVFTGEPVYGPAQIWEMTEIDGLKPVVENPGMLPDLPSLIASLGSKIRDVLNAHDISQGFQSQQYEKATATRLRAAGTERRAMPLYKIYGEAIVAVSEMFIQLNRQFHPESYRFAHKVVVDVPSLTRVSDPDSEKQETMLLLTKMEQDSLFQSPSGRLKYRNLWEKLARLFLRFNINEYVPTEEEVRRDIKTEAEIQNAQLAKMSAQEQLAMEAQQAPTGKESTGEIPV